MSPPKDLKKKSEEPPKEKSSKSSKDNLLLAGLMSEKPLTPSFEAKKSKTSPPLKSTPAEKSAPTEKPERRSREHVQVTGVKPVVQPDARVDSLCATVEAQGKQLAEVLELLKAGSKRKASPSPEQGPSRRRTASPVHSEMESVQDNPEDSDAPSEDEEQQRKPAGSLLEQFSSGKTMFVPSLYQLELWESVLRHDPEWGQEAWMKNNVSHILSKWTSHPEADAFTPPAKDNGLPKLEFPAQKEKEKVLLPFQAAAGGIAAIATRVMALFEGKEIGFVVFISFLSF